MVKQLRKDLAGDDEIIPQLLTIWCAAHRSNLAWDAVSASVQEIAHLFQELVAICSYFRRSGLRSRELRDIASQNNFNVMTLPKLFEIRWSEFTYKLINNILCSWRALVKYFQSSEDSESSGFLSCLTKLKNLKLLTFVADVLSVFSRYQKKLQSDSVTILDIDRASDHLKKR